VKKILAVAALILLIQVVNADKGMIPVDPTVSIYETGQTAIVAWNGEKEVIILSTKVISSKNTYILEVIPLPSKPEVERGDIESFKKISKILWTSMLKSAYRAKGYGVEIVLEKKIGVHELTVVHVRDLQDFLAWTEKFLSKYGFKGKISREFTETVNGYIDRNFSYFVFDVVNSSGKEGVVEPIVYKFESEYLYYPLEITAFSEVGKSNSEVILVLITNGLIEEDEVREFGFWPAAGFKFPIEVGKDEIEDISSDLPEILDSGYIQVLHFYGRLGKLKKDILIGKDEIRVPSPIEKFGYWFRSLPLYKFTSQILFASAGPGPLWIKVIFILILISFLFGIPSVVYVLGRLIEVKAKLGKYSYLVSAILTPPLLLVEFESIASILFVIFVLLGASTILWLGSKLMGKARG